MESNSSFSTITDSDTNTTFAVLVVTDGKLTAHGSMKQGKDWADWVNSGAKSLEQITSSLDPSLRMAGFVPLNRDTLMSRYSAFGPTTAKELIEIVETKSSQVVAEPETKSADINETTSPQPEPAEEPESEPIQSWLMADVGISMFDVQMKKDAVEFKARQFARNKNFSSFVACVKGFKATVFEGRWKAMPGQKRDLSSVLETFDRRIKTNAFSFLDKTGYFEKSVPIGFVNLPPPHLVRNADKDPYIYEGIPWINAGRGIIDPTPPGTDDAVRGIRSLGGRMANILDRPSRVSRVTRRNAENARRNSVAAARNDLNQLVPVGSEDFADSDRLRRRLTNLADAVRPLNPLDQDSDNPRTRRENRRISEAGARIGKLPERFVTSSGEDAMAAMRSERGDAPETPPVVRAAESRIEGDVIPGSGQGRRSETGSSPRGDGNNMLGRLSSRLSRITKRINSSESERGASEELDESDIPSVPTETPRVVPSDPWEMDEKSKQNFLAALKTVVPKGTYATFSSRFGEDDIDWTDFTPAEQSALLRELGYRRTELLATVAELMTPELPGDKDYRSDGVVTPESVTKAIGDNFVSLKPGGANLYADVMSLVAINDVLSSADSDTATKAAAWRTIDNRNRAVISRRADIQRRDVRDVGSRRIQGTIGERTVVGAAEQTATPSAPRLLALSKLQPRRLVFTPEKPSDMRNISDYPQLEQEAIVASAREMRQSISEFLRGNLGISPTTELTEDVLADWMAKSSPENAQRLQQYAHNLIVLDDFLFARNSGNLGSVEWASLTQPARNRILSNANIGTVPQVAKTTASKPRQTKKPRVVSPPVAPPQQPIQQTPTQVVKPSVPIGTTRATGKLENFSGPNQPVVSTVDATNQTVTTTLEDGTQETKPLSSFGRPNQYDFSNSVTIGDVVYVMETNLGLYRDPVSGDYLTDYSKVPISINTQVVPATALEPVQTSKKTGSIVSYPSITPLDRDKNKSFGLTQSQLMTQTQMLSQVFGLDAAQAENLIGSKIYFAPGVMPGKSTDSFRQAAMLMLHTASLTSAIPESEKSELQLLEIVDVPENSDVIEAYLNHIGRPDIAAAYVAAGRPENFLDLSSEAGRQGLNIPTSSLVPAHLKDAVASGSRYYSRGPQLTAIFGGTSDADVNGLVPGMTADSKPRVKKMIVLWRHPENFPKNRYRYSRGLNHTQQVAEAVNKALATDSPADWYEAFEIVRNAYNQAKSQRDDALRKWRGAAGEKSRTPRPRREFILAGDMVEALETIIADIFGPNMDKVADSVRNKKSQTAKITNEMGRLRKRAQQTGMRNVAGLEESLLTPPVNPDGTPMPARSAEEILTMLEQHSTYGFLPHVPRTLAPEDPIEVSELSDEAVSTLALIAMSIETMIDPETQRPLSEIYPDVNNGVTRKHALHNSIYWAIGAKGRPIMVTEEEYSLLLGSSLVPDVSTQVSPNEYVSNFYEIRRGITSAKPGKTTHQMAQEFIDGRLFIPMEGGTAGGYGHNFARTGAGMSSYGGSDPHGDIILAAVPRTARVDSRSRMQTLQGQLQEMFGAFFTQISHFAGIEKTMPIDLDATADPDWRHDNPANPFFREARPNVAHGYFVPHGSRSVGAHRGSVSGDNLIQTARARGMTIPTVDTADPESIRDLAKVIMAAADLTYNPRNSNQRGFEDESEDLASVQGDPLRGDQWWKATRMQVFGWMVQLEIIKAMEMAKMKAEGRVPWSETIANAVAAQEILSWWNDELIQSMLFGVDVYSADSGLPLTTNPVAIMKGFSIGTHIMVVNRTALIVLARPVTDAGEREIVDSIRNPNIRKPGDPSMVWNPYTGKWIRDPDYGKTTQEQT